jgi:hypothetical protein
VGYVRNRDRQREMVGGSWFFSISSTALGIAGLFFGPLVLLILYLRLWREAKPSAKQWF